jgi:hypothetical protein
LSFYWYPRYILFATVPFLVLAARTFVLLAERAARLSGRPPVWLARSWPSRSSPPSASTRPFWPIRSGLLCRGWSASNTWTAFPRATAARGGGLADQGAGARPGRVTVAAETPGRRTLFLCLRTYFMDEPRAELRWLDPNEPVGRRMLLERAAVHPTFVVTGSKEAAGNRFDPLGGVLVAQWRKPNGTLAGELYRVDGRPESGTVGRAAVTRPPADALRLRGAARWC